MTDPTPGPEPELPEPPNESGQEGFHPTPAEVEPKWQPIAIVGFVLSLAGFVLFLGLGIAGFVLGLLALLQINRNPEGYKGKGFAIAAMVIGVADIALAFLL